MVYVNPAVRLACLGAILLAGAVVPAAAGPLAIDAAFPGGNIIVGRIEGDHVYVRQDLRDTAGQWFYWNFRVRGAAGRTLTIHFTGGNVFTRMGPSYSLDGGRSWQWLGPQRTNDSGAPPPAGAFRFRFPDGAADARFALSIPYQESDLKEFLACHAARPELKTGVLCRTPKGRDAEVLYLGRMDDRPDYRIAFTCRHHACESVANYVLEGIMESVLADDETGRWYRGHAAILVVPFVDKDGVDDGDQGKNRKPRDHNRDYGEDTIYPTVAAIKRLLPEWSRGRLDVAIDLHCPYWSTDFIHFVGGPDQEIWGRVLKLCKILEDGQQGPLKYTMADNLAFGQSWNKSTDALMKFNRWASTLSGIWVATDIEFPYALARKKPVTADGARAFGRDLARALRVFLEKELPRTSAALDERHEAPELAQARQGAVVGGDARFLDRRQRVQPRRHHEARAAGTHGDVEERPARLPENYEASKPLAVHLRDDLFNAGQSRGRYLAETRPEEA